MDISSWHRETSLLALSLSIDSALRDDKDLNHPKSGTRKRTVLGRHSSVQPARGLSPHPTRKRVRRTRHAAFASASGGSRRTPL